MLNLQFDDFVIFSDIAIFLSSVCSYLLWKLFCPIIHKTLGFVHETLGYQTQNPGFRNKTQGFARKT